MAETQEHIGKTHSGDLPRDAVHIAVVQVTAGEALRPGDHITKDGIKGGAGRQWIGIVDPFIDRPIKPGDKFYLFLYPGSVTDLTHHYTHPILDADHPKEKARKIVSDWVEIIAHDPDDFQRIYDTALRQYKAREPFDFGGLWRNENDYEDMSFMKPIYDALEVITGQIATKEQREKYYSCCI